VNGGGWTALMMAAAAGHPDTVSWLLKNGAKPSHRNHFGNTVLDMAQTRHNPGLYQLMMEHSHGEVRARKSA
jgi:ankyrin repeat protein